MPLAEDIQKHLPAGTTVTIKVQKPLNGGDLWLYYNQNKTIVMQQLPSKREIELMGDKYKIFVQYKVKASGTPEVNKIKDREWL